MYKILIILQTKIEGFVRQPIKPILHQLSPDIEPSSKPSSRSLQLNQLSTICYRVG